MVSLDFWRLCDELSIVQASLLVVGHDPSNDANYVEQWDYHDRPEGYEACKAAIIAAVRSKEIDATPVMVVNSQFDNDIEQYYEYETKDLDLEKTKVSVLSLKIFLQNKGIKSGFFFNKEADSADYLDIRSPCYSPKLAAAINAWGAVSGDAKLRRGKTVKQALVNWLTVHAAQYGLVKDDGRPNENGIEEIAKIANWDTKGGAPKTPEARTIANAPNNSSQSNQQEDNDIPF